MHIRALLLSTRQLCTDNVRVNLDFSLRSTEVVFVQPDSAVTSYPSGSVKSLILLLLVQGLERRGEAEFAFHMTVCLPDSCQLGGFPLSVTNGREKQERTERIKVPREKTGLQSAEEKEQVENRFKLVKRAWSENAVLKNQRI